jgi:hypothetical protein
MIFNCHIFSLYSTHLWIYCVNYVITILCCRHLVIFDARLYNYPREYLNGEIEAK